MQIILIGAGKMGTAIAGGLVKNGVFAPENLTAADPSPEARAHFEAATGVRCVEPGDAPLAPAQTVILAVKPQVAEGIVRPLAPSCRGKLVISIMAGIPLARLAEWLGSRRIIRVMPNTPLMVGKGAAVFAGDAGATGADRALARKIFGALGVVFELPEEKIDAVTALSGSGPAYVFEFVQALVDAAVDLGLPPEIARDLAVQTVAGAAEMLVRKMGTPDALRDAVTSPGGTTAAALAVFAQADFRALVGRALRAARDRSIELGR